MNTICISFKGRKLHSTDLRLPFHRAVYPFSNALFIISVFPPETVKSVNSMRKGGNGMENGFDRETTALKEGIQLWRANTALRERSWNNDSDLGMANTALQKSEKVLIERVNTVLKGLLGPYIPFHSPFRNCEKRQQHEKGRIRHSEKETRLW